MNILIIGSAEDVHALHLKNVLTEMGVTVDYLNTRLFPSQLRISFQVETQAGWLLLPDGRELAFQDIKSVFWRTFYGVGVPSLGNSYQETVAVNDSMSTLRSLMQACPAKWVNSWQAYEFHKEKPLQLRKAKQIGVTIPATLITNDPNKVTEFAQSFEKLIFKPVYGGAHTQFLTDELLEPKRMSLALRISPVTLQEYIPGTNIRSYVVGDSVYSAEIRSGSLDFREDSKAELIPVEVPESVKEQALAITKAFMLEWTAIDWRLKPTGEYVFLEANFSPMFIHFERQTGFPITQKLVKLLMN